MGNGQDIPAAFSLLANEDNHAADAALLEVLPGLGEAARVAAVDLLLSRAHAPTLIELIEGFPAFDEHLKTLLAGQVNVLLETHCVTPRNSGPAATRGVIELITHSGSGEFAHLLVDTLFGSHQESAKHAAEGLCILGEYYFERGTARSPDDHDGDAARSGFDEFVESLSRTVTGWERHTDIRLLETFLWFDGMPAQAMARKLKEPRTTITKAIKALLRDQPSPRLAGFTMRALGMPALRDAAAKAIRSTSSSAFRWAILARASLAETTEIRRGCRHVGLAHAWLEDIAAFDNLSAKDSHNIISLLTSFCAREAEQISLARQMVDSGQASITRAALSFLCRTKSERSSEALQSLACRQNSPTSAKAANEIRRRTGTYTQDHTQPGLAAATGDDLAPRRAFEQFWQDYDRLDSAELEKLAHAMRPLARQLLPALRTKLGDSQPFLIVRALKTAAWLGVTDQLVEQIYGVCVNGSPVARSFGIRLLGRLPGATSNRILRRAIGDPNERVQANAIEVIDELKLDEKTQLLQPKLLSVDARVRGTAIKSLLAEGHPEAAAALIEMLESNDGRQKKTALWVVDSLNLVAASDRVRELGEGSQDPRIQKTASAVVDKLLRTSHELQQDWRTMTGAGLYGADV